MNRNMKEYCIEEDRQKRTEKYRQKSERRKVRNIERKLQKCRKIDRIYMKIQIEKIGRYL